MNVVREGASPGQLHQRCFIDCDGVDVHALPRLAFATLLFEL